MTTRQSLSTHFDQTLGKTFCRPLNSRTNAYLKLCLYEPYIHDSVLDIGWQLCRILYAPMQKRIFEQLVFTDPAEE